MNDQLNSIEISLDNGVTWVPAPLGVRINIRGATEDDDTLKDLLVNVTQEGIIFDVVPQDTGEVEATQCATFGEICNDICA